MTPSIGRVVWFYPEGMAGGPRAATIACVHSRTAVTIGYLNLDGTAANEKDVRLYDSDEAPPDAGAFCTWPVRL